MVKTTTTASGDYTVPFLIPSTPMVTSIDGITPADRLSNPFPSGLIEPIGSSQGLLTPAGQSVSFTEVTRPINYSQQYSFGLQIEPVRSLLIETTYSGNADFVGTFVDGG